MFEEAYNRVKPKDGPQAVDFMEQVDVGFEEFAPVLKLAKPARSLVELYSEHIPNER